MLNFKWPNYAPIGAGCSGNVHICSVSLAYDQSEPHGELLHLSDRGYNGNARHTLWKINERDRPLVDFIININLSVCNTGSALSSNLSSLGPGRLEEVLGIPVLTDFQSIGESLIRNLESQLNTFQSKCRDRGFLSFQ